MGNRRDLGPGITRRAAIGGAAAVAGAACLPPLAAPAIARPALSVGPLHGLSLFGDLAYPRGFSHWAYVNPRAPKGGFLALQVSSVLGNQNFNTFDTFQIFVLRGNGAAGVQNLFDSLMTGNGDEPDALYGLVARDIFHNEAQNLYRFLLDPAARFADGSPVTAEDVAWSILTLQREGHPVYQQLLRDVVAAEAEAPESLLVRLVEQPSRDLIRFVATLPIFSRAYYAQRPFDAAALEAPLGSGPYRLGRFDIGRFVEYERRDDYWAKDHPTAIGQNNFDRIRYQYYREREAGFQALSAREVTFREEATSVIWHTRYDFPAVRDGRVRRTTIPTNNPAGTQGWFFNMRRAKFQSLLVRRAIASLFDFEWTNVNLMYNSFVRTTSFFDNSPRKAVGLPPPDELALLEPFRAQLPAEAFGEPWVPPVSDGSGRDRRLLQTAQQLLRDAGCRMDGRRLLLPSGEHLTIELLDFDDALQRHLQNFINSLGLLGIEAVFRRVDNAQYQRRVNEFDYDVVLRNVGGTHTPGESLRAFYGSDSAHRPGSRNLSGLAHPAVDALIDRIAKAASREEVDRSCRALDRVLRALHIKVPAWYRADAWIAHWDLYGWPERRPRYGTGAPGTWWYDAEKARRIGL